MTIDIVIEELKNIKIDPEKKKEIVERLLAAQDALKAERAETRQRRSKKELVVTLKSSSELPDDVVAAVWEIPEDSDPLLLVDKIRSAAVDHNTVQTKKRNMISDFSSAITFLKAKFLKNHGVKRLAKDWVRCIQVKEELVCNDT